MFAQNDMSFSGTSEQTLQYLSVDSTLFAFHVLYSRINALGMLNFKKARAKFLFPNFIAMIATFVYLSSCFLQEQH